MPINTGPMIQLPPIPSPDATPETVRQWARDAGIALQRAWQQLYDTIAGGGYVYVYESSDGGVHNRAFSYGQVARGVIRDNVDSAVNGALRIHVYDVAVGGEIGNNQWYLSCFVTPNASATSCAAFLPRLNSGNIILMTLQPDDKWYLCQPGLILKGNANTAPGGSPPNTTSCTSLVGTILTTLGKW